MADRPTIIRPNQKGIFPVVKRGVVHPVALGNGTQHSIVIIEDDGWGNLFCAVQGKGAYAFCTNADPGYIREKLLIKNEPDARNICDFLNDQMRLNAPRKGEYTPVCCAK